MSVTTTKQNELIQKRCVPCEGGIPVLARTEADALLESVHGWAISADGKRIRRSWIAKNFMAAIDFFNQVAELAESEGHHPDLHLEGYRNVAIEITTHAIDGLSENDFILAAKINEIPVQVKQH